MAVRRFGVVGRLARAGLLGRDRMAARVVSAAGFRWVLLGSSQATVIPVVQLASVTGVYGLSALVALVGTAAAALALSRRPVDRWAAAGVGVLLVVRRGRWRVSRGRRLADGDRHGPCASGWCRATSTRRSKWNPAYRDAILERYIGLSRQAHRRRRAARHLAGSVDAVLLRRRGARSPRRSGGSRPSRARRSSSAPTSSSAAEPGGQDRFYNSAVLVGADGRTRGTYRKMRLVPFGEYVPFKQLLFFVGPLVEAVSDFSAGTEPVVFDVDGRRISVAICYESIYPWIARAFVDARQRSCSRRSRTTRGSAGRRRRISTSSRARCARSKKGRYLVRAANTGISGAVDPYGRVARADAGCSSAAAMTVDVRLLTGRTIYSRIGDVVAWFSAVGRGGRDARVRAAGQCASGPVAERIGCQRAL